MKLLIVLSTIVSTVVATTYHPFVELNFDFVGHDIANVSASAVDKCTEHCENTPGCKAYSWNGYNGGTCWLKNARENIVPKYGVISSYMWESNINICNELIDYDIVGNDVQSVPSPDKSKCCYICSRAYNCRSYSWSNYNSGTCFLKSGRGVVVKKQGVVSADVYPNDTPLTVINENCVR